MAQRLRIVFDTNVYIAAAINPSGPSDAWLRIAGRHNRSYDLYTSKPILEELTNKLITKFRVQPTIAKNFVDNIRQIATVVKPKISLRIVKDDPDDNMLFECAVTAKAQLIVSADKAVLKLNPVDGIGVCHPRDLKNIFAQDLR